MSTSAPRPPSGGAATRTRHRVQFFETDGMRIVHHANYVRWFEQARIEWMDQHDVPYARYVELGLHFATTRIEVDYRRSARFDDRVDIETWIEDVGGASLAMGYRISLAGEVLVTGRSEHACVDDEGRVRRIPRERRENLRACLVLDAESAGSRD